MIRDDYGLNGKKPLGIVYVENGEVHIRNIFSDPMEDIIVESIDDIKKMATKKMLKREDNLNDEMFNNKTSYTNSSPYAYNNTTGSKII